MEIEIRQQYLNSIIDNMASIKRRVSNMNYEEFEKNEMAKEEVYSELQEIGKVADEMLQLEEDTSIINELEILAKLKNATYNQQMEIQHHQAWAIITNDLDEIGETIEKSPEYSATPQYENWHLE